MSSPNVQNYLIGKGNVYFTPQGGERRHMGNCPTFEVELEITELEHFSSMEGVRTKDLTVVTEKGGTVRLVLEEFTPENLAVALLGDQSVNTEGNIEIAVFSQNLIRGRLELIGSNEVGPKINWDFPSVAFRPDAAIAGISEEWGTLEVLGDIESVNGSFGTVTVPVENTETATPTATVTVS